MFITIKQINPNSDIVDWAKHAFVSRNNSNQAGCWDNKFFKDGYISSGFNSFYLHIIF